MAPGTNHQSGWAQRVKPPASFTGYNQFGGLQQQQQMQQSAMNNGRDPAAGRPLSNMMLPVTFPNMQNGYAYSMPTLNSGASQLQGQSQRQPTAQAQFTPRMTATAPSLLQQHMFAQNMTQQQQQVRNGQAQSMQEHQAGDLNFAAFDSTAGLAQQHSLSVSPYATPPVSFNNTPTQHPMAIDPKVAPSSHQQAEQRARQHVQNHI
jgi:hypothetical protein